MTPLLKYQLSTHVFSDPEGARAISADMGLGGYVHIHQVDGQAYYMPGETHEAYLAYMGQQEPVTEDTMERALRAVVAEIMGKSMDVTFLAEVIKADVEDRLIWGWAYVCTVDGEKSLDHSGEWVSPETMLKASTNFMLNTRTAKVNHEGDKEGDIIHSFPITKELALALGIQTDREGWIIGTRVSAATVQKVLNGELTSFSIGGRALKRSL